MKKNVIRRRLVEPKSGADGDPDPRDGGQTLAHWVALVPRENLRLELIDPCLDVFDLADDYLQHRDCQESCV